jgi:excinuclease UvrABC helicase subunit UvrB
MKKYTSNSKSQPVQILVKSQVSEVKKKEKKIKLDRSQLPKRNIVVSEAIIRPTGLLDPQIVIKPVKNQVDDVLEQVRLRVAKGQRVLVTTLTKKFAEELDLYFKQINIKSAYIHSDVETLDRLDILSDLRSGKYDVLIGINLLREGLDLPEVSLVAIFDADKEGFLRSRTSLIQIVGRAARHSEGQVIMYADTITRSMKAAIEETQRRREIQSQYNLDHNIVPKSTKRELKTISDTLREEVEQNENYGKAGAILTTDGFVENKDFEIKSRFSRKKSKSVHREEGQNLPRSKNKQVFANFDTEKEIHLSNLKLLKLSTTELQERLQIAIDAYNFEEAAAIRDLLESN